MDNINTTTRMANITLARGIRRGTGFLSSLNKPAWFAGLYFASLVCLIAIGAGMRWVLASL